MKEGKKTIRVKVEAEIVPVEIDESTTAKELVRKVIPSDALHYIHFAVFVNGAALRDEDKMMQWIKEDDDIRVVPTLPD